MEHHEIFNQKSDLYAKVRPQYPKELIRYLKSICNGHEAVWDGACGNGQASVDLAHYFSDVQATDISEGQIVNAIQNPKVTYSVQPCEETDFCENQFDLVCIAQALHWFDYDQFWPEVRRVLKPKAVFAAWGYSWFSVEERIDDLVQEKLLRWLKPYWAEQNKLLWDHYRNIPFPFKRIEPPQIEMVVEWDLDQLFSYLRSWSAVRRCVADMGESIFMNAFDALKGEWGDFNRKRRVEMDFCMLVGRNE